MSTYKLGATPARREGSGWSIMYSLRGLRLVDEETTIEAKNADELEAAKRAHGLHVLSVNALTLRAPESTDPSPIPPLEAVAVDHRPIAASPMAKARHAPGCAKLSFTMIVDRP